MSTAVRQLFRELVDVPHEERDRILAERQVPENLSAEVLSLLCHDSTSDRSLTIGVSVAFQRTLSATSEVAPRSCGPYRLVHLLGSGGMGSVYLAERHDGEIEQQVAIKLLRADADRPAWRERFLKERQLLAYLNHPSIARLLDAGHTADGRPYLVMERVEGVHIDEYAAPLDLHAKLKLFLRVCEGVSHAHRHLIIHRDLKPSNILVDSCGNPKLLDFGIARLVDSATDQTRTVERLLTPDYASPEQVRNDVQTTATDVYSLGGVLCKLLTGLSPRVAFSESPPTRGNAGDRSAPSNPRTELPRDIKHILRKALRQEPSERYVSVDAFADDIRAFLESKPVKARSGDAWYRTRKFLRRHRHIATAASLALTTLLLGANMVSHERGIAETRSLEVRQLAHKILALDEVAGGLHGSSEAMNRIVAISKQHLEAFVAEAALDRAPTLDVVEAYSLLARAHGICMATNPEQRALAEQSLRKAEIFLEPFLAANPNDRKALLTAGRISHDRMTVAENDRRNSDAVAHARRAVTYLDRFVDLGQLSPAESEAVSEFLYDVALSHKNLHLTADGIRFARQSVEIAPSSPDGQLRRSLGLSMLADLLRLSGDLEGALLSIREARANLQQVRFPNETERRSAWSRVLGREGKILGVPGGINLNRPSEAAVPLQRAFELVEEWTQADPQDAWSRLLFVSLGRELGDTLRLRDPERALAVYDHALLRVREVKNNPEALRGEAELLAGSVYALRRLNRNNEADNRINTAFRLLSETKDHPADRISPYSAAYEALRASGDHLSETGQAEHALRVYESLLDKVMLSNPDARNDLRHALALSDVYGSLALLYRRNGQSGRGRDVAALRLELWRHWDSKLPKNSFVRRQLAAARS